MSKQVFGVLFFLLLTILSFENCSKVGFDSQDSFGEVSTDTFEIDQIDDPSLDIDTGFVNDPTNPGLLDGHFDLDTTTSIYAFNKGQTDKHIHEYDDKYGVNNADFFNLKDKDLVEIYEAISDDEGFFLIVANAELSTKAILEINGKSQSALSYQTLGNAALKNNSAKVYKLNPADANALKSLKIGFNANAILEGGLVSTQTSCVVKNNRGAKEEYRSGALTIQAISASNYSIDPYTGVAASGLLWEATIFWHEDGGNCY